VITIERLKLRNWRCFKGDQELALRSTFYALVATSTVAVDRSNRLGKSSLVGAIDWCLHGRMPEDCRRKADLITRGEKGLEVELNLSSGHRIVRTFSAAHPERVTLFPPGNPEGASMNAEAQGQIEQIIGLNREDFLLCYMRQREMARMVSMDPGTRMETVSSWIRLEPLERCEDDAQAVLAEFSTRVEGKRRERADAEAVVRWELERHGCKTGEEVAGRAAVQVGEVERLERELGQFRWEKEKGAERARLAEDAVRYDAIIAQGRELAARNVAPKTDALEASEGELGRELQRLGARCLAIGERVRARMNVSLGHFDGVCPIAGKACPAQAFVVSETSANLTQAALDKSEDEATGAEYEAKHQEHLLAQEALRVRRRDSQRLDDLREEARRLRVSKEKHAKLGAPTGTYDPTEAANVEVLLEGARRLHTQLSGSVQAIEARGVQIATIDEELVQLERAARVAAAGAAIFGKGGAQRRMAEGALAEIEDRANQDVLAVSGIELSVKVVWSRETAGLAAQCSGCGAAFPASRRVRECARCGAERGAQLTNKLELEPSERSGGADDLAGFAFQVGASAWLRQDRMAGWGVAMLDELFGALDGENRRALASHLPGLLGRAGFGQGIVIAHHASVLDALPGRIEIVSDGKHSTARVVDG